MGWISAKDFYKSCLNNGINIDFLHEEKSCVRIVKNITYIIESFLSDVFNNGIAET